MKITFTDKKPEKLANDDRRRLKELGKTRSDIFKRRLAQLKDAET